MVMGDHQPAANVTGEGASWEVPVHIISANPQLLERFATRGFKPGLEPSGPSIGKLFDLTRMLVDVFDSGDGKTKTQPSPAPKGVAAAPPKTLP